MNTRPLFLSIIFCGAVLSRNAAGQTTDSLREDTTAAAPPAINFQILERRKIKLGNQAMFLNRVVPPVLPPKPAAARPAPEPILTLEQRQALAEREAKKSVVLFLSVTVYDRQVSELRWSDESGAHRAFSNIDFNYIAGMGGFETPDASYTLMMGLGNATREERIEYNRNLTAEDLKNGLQLDVPPSAADFSATRSEYMVVEDKEHPSAPETFIPLDALHVYFDANKQRLIDDYGKREAANATRQQWLKDHPPVPKDIVVNYWRKPNELPTAEGAK